MTLKSVGLVLGTIAISTSVNAQKSNVTSAAVEYQKVERLMGSQDWDGMRQALETAKEFIDPAAEHPDTKDWDKMFWYRGNIYASLAMMDWMKDMIGGEEMKPLSDEAKNKLEIAIKSYDVGYDTGKKYKRNIEDEVIETVGVLNTVASALYAKEEMAVAGDVYNYGAQFKSSIDVLDSAMTFNSGLCYENAEMWSEAGEQYAKLAAVNYRGTTGAARAAYCYRQAGEYDKAKAIVVNARKTYPNDKDLLTELVNISIDQGDNEAAKQALDDAIAADPNNPALHYIIGTIYMSMENNQEAEESLRKALEIKPDYVNAQYQLGAHLFNWYLALSDEASFLDIGDSNIPKLEKKADEKLADAVKYLEMYIESEPNDKPVLNILYKAYYKMENTEKALEYKKRYDAL